MNLKNVSIILLRVKPCLDETFTPDRTRILSGLTI